MKQFREIYRRLDLLQAKLSFRVAASAIVLVLAGIVFVPLFFKAQSIASQRHELVSALAGQSLERRDPIAVALFETGTVELGGKVYGGEWFRDEARFGFDELGNIVSHVWLANRLLADQRPVWAPDFLVDQPDTTQFLALVATGSMLLVVWLNLSLVLLLTALAATVCALPFYWARAEQWMMAVLGVALLSFSYMLFSRAMLLALRAPFKPCAVAHTVVKEASRSKLSLFFIGLFVILLPLVPLRLDPEAPLRFRVQTFLATSLDLTYYIAAMMTLFLACATIAFEIRDKQIWQLMSKPVGRFNYLIGKWMGVLAVNLVILLVSGVSVFMYVQWLRQLPVKTGMEGQLDRMAVEDEVLAARLGIVPDDTGLTQAQILDRVDLLIARDPDLSQLEHVDALTRRKLFDQVIDEHSLQQRSIPAGRGREYVFSGLQSARERQSSLALRYKFFIGASDEHQRYDVVFEFNKEARLRVPQTYIPTMTHTLPIGSHLIRDDGTISLTIYNAHVPREGDGANMMMFDPGGLELMYRVGDFEPNYVRAVLGMWIKLSFLAVLGVACSTLLSFPVACLFAFTVFLGGTIAPFLADSLREYYPPDMTSESWSNIGLVIQWTFESVIRAIANAIVYLLDWFGRFTPQTQLVEGRLISWVHLAAGFFWIGLVCPGIVLFLGYVVFRSRELATYSGQS